MVNYSYNKQRKEYLHAWKIAHPGLVRDYHKRNTITLVCSQCQKEFQKVKYYITQTQKERPNAKFYCSRKCVALGHINPKAVLWKGYWIVRKIINGKFKRIFVHIRIAEKVLGRKMKEGEVVHHINGDKSDNRHKNLVICDNHYHKFLHERMARLWAREHLSKNPNPILA